MKMSWRAPILTVLIISYCDRGVSQEEISVWGAESVSVPELSEPPAPLPPQQKLPLLAEKKPASDRQHSVLSSSFAYFRFMENSNLDLKTGVVQNKTGLNLPGSTYLIATNTFRSTSGSQSNVDLQTFSTSYLFFSPHLYNTGLIGSFDSSGAGTQTGRMGVYFKLSWATDSTKGVIVPAVTVPKNGSKVGRMLILWLFNYREGLFIFDGSTSYLWNNEVDPKTSTASFDPAISIRIYESLRAVVTAAFSKTGDVVTKSSSYGLEMRFSF
jgi:hypothetical protein